MNSFITIFCNFTYNFTKLQIAWFRQINNRTKLIGHESQKFIQSDRYSILSKEGINELTIYNVIERDSGNLICQINTEPMKNYVSIYF